MKPVYTRFKRHKPLQRAAPGAKKTKAPTYTYGLPKAEYTRRLMGVGCSYRDAEEVIAEALAIVEALLVNVRSRACAACGTRRWVEAHHVLTRGARHPDFGNVAPACHDCHAIEQSSGLLDVDFAAVARRVTWEHLAAHPRTVAFLRFHCLDPHILQLCKEASL